MRTVARRLQELEWGFGLGPESEQLLMVVTTAGRGLALDQDRRPLVEACRRRLMEAFEIRVKREPASAWPHIARERAPRQLGP